ncbi:RNA-binding protein Hfq [Variibacter gotjawalensis]|jgi:host factor-I protein|uniref:RNA-binding protein Hfq n=1 Tax=Variibacter gotjawalensis TaxID=1333996 RepID=A0A0S3PTH4_9BRAD|nr:host factor-I protein [Variibacter gotjawalensis]RZS45585.1 host factor-I protein [Variibacter gotjawalensis]BAT59258.1 RNA-binding protein Hfq [Variibacter gotjawalensis]
MANNPQRLQDTFLDHLQKNATPITIFLINGVKLQGVVTGHDNFCIMLGREGQAQAVYKQAISTITSNYPIELWEDAPPKDKPARPAPRATATRAVVVERRPLTRKPPPR